MEKPTYVNISLPRSLIDEIDKIIGTRGYTSVPEFIKESCRIRLDKITARNEDA